MIVIDDSIWVAERISNQDHRALREMGNAGDDPIEHRTIEMAENEPHAVSPLSTLTR